MSRICDVRLARARRRRSCTRAASRHDVESSLDGACVDRRTSAIKRDQSHQTARPNFDAGLEHVLAVVIRARVRRG